LYNFGTKKPKKEEKKKGVGNCWRKVSSVCLIPLLNPSDKKKKKRKKRPERERERRQGGFRERKCEPKKTALTLSLIHSHLEKLILSYSHSDLSKTLHFFSSP
jgi:hypothetical protein